MTIVPCTGMQCIKTQVLGNRCSIKYAFWPYIYLDSSTILVYQYTVPYMLLLSYLNPNKYMTKKWVLCCIPVQGITVSKVWMTNFQLNHPRKL